MRLKKYYTLYIASAKAMHDNTETVSVGNAQLLYYLFVRKNLYLFFFNSNKYL